MTQFAPINDGNWHAWKSQWRIRKDTVYLNHGSFGPPPEPVRAARLKWIQQLDAQPMDFFVRTLDAELKQARKGLARFVGTSGDNLVFVENATYGMNVVAECIRLTGSDEVLLTDHEYGAVQRIWERACHRAGVPRPTIAHLPLPVNAADQVADAIFDRVTERTRLIVISHITSPTAMILPVQQICQRARKLGITTCVDGPHALLQMPVEIDQLGCDYYTASCHKWLCAPFGSGFLYVNPLDHETIQPQVLSWGSLSPDHVGTHWSDEFAWSGTHDPSAYLSVPAAIEFFANVGVENFRRYTHGLAQYARQGLVELTKLDPLVPDSDQWYGSMTLGALPPGDCLALQNALWEADGIEVPIIGFADRRFVRVSCHLYNCKQDIDNLLDRLATLLGQGL